MANVVFIGDVYCGWCHGFDPEFLSFLEKHPEIKLEVLTGGLKVPPYLKPAGDEKAKLAPIIEKIKKIYPRADFTGKLQVMEEGTRICDSTHPGSVLQLVKKYANGLDVFKFFVGIQHKFFVEAADLAKPEAYVEVIKALGLDDKISKADIEAALKDSTLPNDDYKKAMEFGVQTFPTLAVEENGSWRVFPADGMHESDLEREILK